MRFSGERGLTLLELLVALALLSLIGLGLTSTIGTSKRVWEESERYSVTLEEVNTRQLLKRVLENAFIGVIDKVDDKFAGTRNTLDFKSTHTLSRLSPLNTLKVNIYNNADGLVLDINESNRENGEITHHSRNLRSKIASVSYYDHNLDQWLDNWQKTVLPRLVYIQFENPNWPNLAVHLINS